VTAERREASLQDTAIAITAIGADALIAAGVSHPEDLNSLVPGLGIAQGGSSTQIYVRGVGNYGTNALADPAVAFNMDAIYIARFSGISGNFYDLERVEVLKGPQGTLYGRNATGGAINIVTNKPTHDFAAGVGLEAGNYSLFKANGFVNVPLTDTVAIRFAGQSTDRDGYQTDGYDDDVSKSARLHVLVEPSDNFKLLFTGGYTDIGGNGAAQIPVSTSGYVDNDNPWLGLSEAAPIALSTARTGLPPFLGVATLRRDDGKLDITVKSFTAQMDADVGLGTLTVLGNYMDTDNDSKSYGPGFLFWQHDTAKQSSLEARLAGESGPVNWVGGLYYFKEDQTTNYWVDQGLGFNQTGVDLDQLDDKTAAAFAQVTYSVTDSVHLTAGVRYTNEKKEQNGNTYTRQGSAASTACTALFGTPALTISQVAAAIPLAGMTGSPYISYTIPGVGTIPIMYCADSMTGQLEWNDTSWKVGVDIDVAEDSMLYASVSRGFKAGGFFSAGDHTDTGNTFAPETLIAYAVGSKNRFLNNRLQLNGEVFFWDYNDHQESYLAPLFNGNIPAFGFITQRADAEIYGLDLELDALLSDQDAVGLKLQYLHAEYTDATFRISRPAEFNPGAVAGSSRPSTVCTPTLVAQGLYSVDCTGQQMPRSPEISLTADYHHTFDLNGGGRIVPGVRAQYSSSYWSAVDYNALQKQDAYTIYGADLMFESASKAWSVTAYGANLGEKAVYLNSFMYPGTNVAMNSLRAPRTYGVRTAVKF
jgi:iron complex outermembrane receptor protein